MPVNPNLLRRYKQQIAVYRDRTSALLVVAWSRLDGIDEDQVATFAQATAVPLGGAKAVAVALSSAFFALNLGIRPVGVDVEEVAVDPDIRGPFRASWHALAMGRPFEDALSVGRSTARAVGFDFVQHAARRTGDVVAERSGRDVKWRRVPGGKSCPWCIQVAGQTYNSAEAADFGHERCDCDAVPV